MFEDGAFSHKIDYVTIGFGDFKSKGYQNPSTYSKVKAILLNGWILHIGGASAVEDLLSTGHNPSSKNAFMSMWLELGN